MVHYLANKTAHFLAKDDDPEDIEVIAYGYYMFYQQWLVTIAILLTGWAFGVFFPVLASLIVFMTLRGCVRGTHATHPLICRVATFAMVFAPVVLSVVLGVRLLPVLAVMLYLACIAMLIKYAPGDTDVQKFRDPRVRKQMKIQSIVWVSVFFLAAVLLNGHFPEISLVVAVAAFLTCGFVHPLAYRAFGFDPVTKEAFKPRQ